MGCCFSDMNANIAPILTIDTTSYVPMEDVIATADMYATIDSDVI